MSAPATDKQIAAIERMTTPERLARLSKADAAVVLGALLPPSNQSSAQRSFLWRLIAALQPNEVRDLIADLRVRLGVTTDDAPIPPPYGERRHEQGDHRARLPTESVGSPTPPPPTPDSVSAQPRPAPRPRSTSPTPSASTRSTIPTDAPFLRRFYERHPDDGDGGQP